MDASRSREQRVRAEEKVVNYHSAREGECSESEPYAGVSGFAPSKEYERVVRPEYSRRSCRSGVMNPFVDWGFKHLFGTERNKRNLIGFLNLVLELECPIVDVEFLNNENISQEEDGRECVFDVLCIDEAKTRFLIEVQNAPISYISNRILYYTCRLIDQMGQVGDQWSYNIDKVYSICLMNFMYEDNPVLKREYMLRESHTGVLFTDRIHIVMLQLPCLKAKNLAECNLLYEKLLFLLLQMKNGMKTIEELKQQVYEHGLTDEIRDTFINVLDEASLASLSKTDKAAYDRKLKTYRDNLACLDYAIEHGIRQGLEMGEEKGIAKGREQGRQEGRSEGLLEGANAKQLEIAKAFKAKGVDLRTISECTGLSEDEIAKL